MRHLPTLSLCLLAAYLTLSAEGCMETVRLPGRLGTVLESFSFLKHGGDSCRCCALCHRNPACASLGFSAATSECQLYGSVAGYDTLIKDDSWTYFVMPRRSQHHQFCRQDSDCLVQGDFCRGRVCTGRNTVTCRVIIETFGAKNRFGNHFTTLGWIGGASHSLFCQVVGVDALGFTRVFLNTAGAKWTMETVDDLSPSGDSHSLLYLTDDLLQTSQEPTYKVRMYFNRKATVVFDDIPRTEPLVAEEFRREPSGVMNCKDVEVLCSISLVSLPYRGLENSDSLLLLDDDVDFDGKQVREQRSLARTDGRMFKQEANRIAIAIRE